MLKLIFECSFYHLQKFFFYTFYFYKKLYKMYFIKESNDAKQARFLPAGM